MALHRADADNIRTIVVTPAVTRVFWAQPRAWHGDVIRMHIETQHVPDGTPLVLQVWEDDSGEGSPDDFVARLPDGLVITNNRCIVEHKLVFDAESLGDPYEVEGDAFEFYFEATIADYALQMRSNLLYVAIEAFKLSG